MLLENQFSTSIPNNLGNTPLMELLLSCASQTEQMGGKELFFKEKLLEDVKTLIKFNADINHANNEGKTALTCSLMLSKNTLVVKSIREIFTHPYDNYTTTFK